ncbi:MAG TPA: c-type cytochrome [Anaerolineales bacterium]|nr:c-type cytochrome [Anaerolineales bacterium]
MEPRNLSIPGLALLIATLLVVALALAVPATAQEGPDPETLALGAELYQQNCAVCHGADGEGRIGATLAKDWPAIRTDLRLKETISNGVAGSFMPPWSQDAGGPLTEAEIDALVAVILNNQTSDPSLLSDIPTPTLIPPITPIPDVEGDPAHGAMLFAQNCAVCHGANGEGRIGATLAQDWPAIRTDLRLKETISTGVAGSFMPPWSQEAGGPLASGEIDDLVAYILTLSSVQSAGGTATAAPVSSTPAATPTAVEDAEPVVTTGVILAGILIVLVVIGGGIWILRAK